MGQPLYGLAFDADSVCRLRSFEAQSKMPDPRDAEAGLGPARTAASKEGWQRCVVTLDVGMLRNLRDWINATLRGSPTLRSGAVMGYDAERKTHVTIPFTNAIVTSLRLPDLNALSRSAAVASIGFAAKMEPPKKKQASGPGPLAGHPSDPRASTAADFRVRSRKLTSVPDFTRVTPPSLEVSLRAHHREYLPGPAMLGDLSFFLPERSRGPYDAWIESSLREESAADFTLELAARDKGKALLSVQLRHVRARLLAAVREERTGRGEAPRVWRSELCCEKMTLS